MLLQLTSDPREQRLVPILRMPFRPLFLAASAYSALALAVWGLSLAGWLRGAAFASLFWHSHELLFGFAATVGVGFALTASQTWTGQRAPHGGRLLALCCLWLSARLSFVLGTPRWLSVTLDAAFFVTAAALIAVPVWATRNLRNLFFAPMFLAFGALSLAHGLLPARRAQVALLTVLLVVQMMVVVGGRVIPFFTARRLGREPAARLPWLEWPALSATPAVALALLLDAPRAWLAGLCALGCALLFARALRWGAWRTLRIPLLWSLHLSFAFVALGFGLLALHYADLIPTTSPGIHSWTVGGMGGLILSMESRVSLGHTGRPLRAPPLIPLAFSLLAVCALVRVAGPLLAPGSNLYLWSVPAWLLGYGIFVRVYAPILWSPRADGRPG